MSTREEKIKDLLNYLMEPEDLELLEQFHDDMRAGTATAEARLAQRLDVKTVGEAKKLRKRLIELAEVAGLAVSRLEDLYETITPY